ncbi:SUN domain-containing protein 1 isoform X2 [Myxocyprinus asiaticus]|uniref:SUN domain-containing protein 1 isoform X2 n=1 Tax=Myxocyprinus asiaticus TaxID=70543 RepID=UPI00222354CB|nr:SUN domain-containing protein 1 isoform X2 [Myxocyprinus asiaticus]
MCFFHGTNADDTWGLESWGWTVLSSYSSSVLDLEKEHRICPVYQSPRMSRRSLRLHPSTSYLGDNSVLDSSLHNSANLRIDDKNLRRRPIRSWSTTIYQGPRSATTSFQDSHNSTLNSFAPSDSSLLDESSIQERTLVDSFWARPLQPQQNIREASMQVFEAQNGYLGSESTRDYQPSRAPISARHTAAAAAADAAGGRASSAASSGTAAFANPTVYGRDSRRQKPGKTASGSFWWLVDLFSKCLPMFSKLLFLVPFLLFLALWYWGPSGLLAMLPAASRTSSHLTPPTTQTSTSNSEKGQTSADTDFQRVSVLSTADSERLTRLEDRMAQLWDRVAGALLRQEEQHTEVLSLYNTLRVEVHRHTDRESMGKWIGDMLEERFSHLQGEVEKEAKHTQQRREKHTEERETENTRLAEAEALLQTLARRTEELQRKQEPAKMKVPEAELRTPEPDSEESEDTSSSELLLAEVKRLEEALAHIRDDVQGLMGCRDKCEQLYSLQSSVSEQVEREVRSMFYGSDRADELELPQSFLQWVTDQFVSTTELQASLIALERNILGNLSLQIGEGQSPSKETIAQTVRQATSETGLTEEDVQLIVNNTLKLYSEDRTGLVDYAMEAGGGSIIGTRCTVSHESKTALLSLFGLPLWYFSQSPRVVIQPDVHPGNCWAFKGSEGYLVIRLSMMIVPTAFTLEHIPKSLSPTSSISSAPREFNVYGLDDEYQEEGQLLGQFVYEEDGDALQTFTVTEEVMRGFQIIELRVLSNWGHPEYTCLYRFRVHGKLVDE